MLLHAPTANNLNYIVGKSAYVSSACLWGGTAHALLAGPFRREQAFTVTARSHCSPATRTAHTIGRGAPRAHGTSCVGYGAACVLPPTGSAPPSSMPRCAGVQSTFKEEGCIAHQPDLSGHDANPQYRCWYALPCCRRTISSVRTVCSLPTVAAHGRSLEGGPLVPLGW